MLNAPEAARLAPKIRAVNPEPDIAGPAGTFVTAAVDPGPARSS
jgi:hypothetical protein